MCVDYIDLNKACPKDSYALANIDRLIDGAACHTILSFLDAYSPHGRSRERRGQSFAFRESTERHSHDKRTGEHMVALVDLNPRTKPEWS